ncbi:ribose-phosphate pyrophosphokinase 1 [Mitosporidium daphniae]
MKQIRLLSGSSHVDLAQKIAFRVGVPVAPITLKRTACSESVLEIHVSVRNHEVFIVQTGNCFSGSIDEYLVELLIIVNACKHASSGRIIVILPYFPYSRYRLSLRFRYGKKDSPRGSISANLVAQMLQVAGVNHILTVDLHSQPIQDFFNIPFDNLRSESLLAKAIFSASLSMLASLEDLSYGCSKFENLITMARSSSPVNFIGRFSPTPDRTCPAADSMQDTSSNKAVILSTPSTPNPKAEIYCSSSVFFRGDIFLNQLFQENCVIIVQKPSSTKSVAALADRLGLDFALVTSETEDDNIESICNGDNLVGNVKSKIAWIFTDIIDDPSSFITTAKIVRASGALMVGVVAIHPLLTNENMARLEQDPDIDIVNLVISYPVGSCYQFVPTSLY